MTTASDIIASARKTLQDYDEDRWADADMLPHVNGARRMLIVANPKAYSVVDTVDLVAGPQQTVPADCHVFYGPLRNRGASGEYGRAITLIQREYIDAFLPMWQGGGAAEIDHFAYDERTPGVYLVYPPAAQGTKIDVAFAKAPADLQLNGTLNMAETVLADSLADYVVARLLLDDAASPVNQQRALTHLQLFSSVTGANIKALLRNSPNAANVGGIPPRVAQGE